jgi:hypothetical protein
VLPVPVPTGMRPLQSKTASPCLFGAGTEPQTSGCQPRLTLSDDETERLPACIRQAGALEILCVGMREIGVCKAIARHRRWGAARPVESGRCVEAENYLSPPRHVTAARSAGEETHPPRSRARPELPAGEAAMRQRSGL